MSATLTSPQAIMGKEEWMVGKEDEATVDDRQGRIWILVKDHALPSLSVAVVVAVAIFEQKLDDVEGTSPRLV